MAGYRHVFTRPDGSPVTPDRLTQDFSALVQKHDLPHLTFHGLRHAFATLGLVAGTNPKVVSEALGHSSVRITLDLYSHVLPNMQDELAGAVANLLKRES
ncbi:MAG: tyrosine-type recombinase/integrase [Chloroflexi bacterium]|nr:tyrosine-type recombinase/integrase [Chloroflexota bacterium]